MMFGRQRRSFVTPCNARPTTVSVERLESRTFFSATLYVSPTGSDANPGTDPDHAWRTIQQAMNNATPGSTVNVLPGRYNEKLNVNVSGNATDGFITFQAMGRVIISGVHQNGADIIAINNQNYIRIIGFDIRDNLRVNNGSGIRLTSGGDHIEIRNNRIHNIAGVSAMGITVYGTDPQRAISNLIIDGNEIFGCRSAPSETLTLNGNVHDFAVTNNFIHQVKGIGIDFISGEGFDPDPATDVTHDGVCVGNRIMGAHFREGRDTAGIWVDGSENIIVERNVSVQNGVGIEVGAVSPTRIASNITVRDNYVARNMGPGISIGGSDAAAGRVQDCQFTNNTIQLNDTGPTTGQLRIQFASGILMENNLILGRPGGLLINAEFGSSDITSDYNVMFGGAGRRLARFAWDGGNVRGFDTFQAVTGQEQNSLFVNPRPLRMINGIPHLLPISPAVNAGDPAFITADTEVDIDGDPRVLGGRIDVGADESV